MKEAIDMLAIAAIAIGLIGIWLCLIYTEPKKSSRNHKSSDILGGNL